MFAMPGNIDGVANDRRSGGLDEVDRALVRLLHRDGRMPNNALAAAAGIAPSTCLARVRSLQERGVVRGVHADIDMAALDRPLQALVAVKLAAHAREQIARFREMAPGLPGVLGVFHVTGSNDYLLHVAVRDPEALRSFVLDQVAAQPGVAHAETSLIFEHVRGHGLPDLG
jgi:DNA-binding Lrp family transcriptional regulator